MSKTQKQIDEFFKSKKEQEQTLQPRSQMILNDEPLPSSKEQLEVTSFEWTNEKQLEWELKRKEESHKKALERMAMEKAQLYTDNVLLKREIEELKIKASSKSMAHICMQDDADRYFIELEEYRNLKDEVHSDIEKVWMFDATLTKDLSAYHKRKRSEAIERVFYKIANEWID